MAPRPALLIILPLLVKPCFAIPLGGSDECPCVRRDESGYGFGCRAHDNNTMEYPECVSSEPPAWCEFEWCYVETQNCAISKEPSTDYANYSWSYATCGYRDLFTYQDIGASLRGSTLRVMFLSNTGGWKGNFCTGAETAVCVNQRGYGPINQFFDIMSGTAGINIQQIRELPEAAVQQALRENARASAFDQCTWATGMGFVDVCVASLVVLPRRAEATQMVALWAEPTVLVAPAVAQIAEEYRSFWAMMAQAFRPFTTELWFTMLAVVIANSLIVTYFETLHGQFSQIKSNRRRVAEAFYRAFHSLFMCESRFEPETLGGRIVGLGLAFLLVLVVCGYTANLASFLVVAKRSAPEISNLDDAVRMNFKICAHISHFQTLLSNGVPEDNIVIISSRSDVLPSIGTSCGASVLSSEDFESAQATNGGSFCNLHIVGGPIGSIMVGLPVSAPWVQQIRYAVTDSAMEGYLQMAFNAQKPKDHCAAINAQAEVMDNAQALTVESMFGPFMVSLFFTLLGFVAHLLRTAFKKSLKTKAGTEIVRRTNRVQVAVKHRMHLDRLERHSSNGSGEADGNKRKETFPGAEPDGRWTPGTQTPDSAYYMAALHSRELEGASVIQKLVEAQEDQNEKVNMILARMGSLEKTLEEVSVAY